MRLLVCGDRHWKNFQLLWQVIGEFNPDVIIEGGARGADTMAKTHAELNEIELLHFPANWELYGKKAGPIRNYQMLREGKPDIVIGFHENINESRGTKHMLTISKQHGIMTYIHDGKQLNQY